jgi:rubredoxin
MIELRSTITCPQCGFQSEEEMPVDACLRFYRCRRCDLLLRPKPGDCCVFCSYGTVRCPSMQEEDAAGGVQFDA